MSDDAKDSMQMDANALFREEVYTDHRFGTIRILTPVNADTSIDSSRKILYLGQAQFMTPAGALPVSFELQADSLKEAAEKFGDQAQQAAQETLREINEMRRQQASSIVLPGEGGAMGGLPAGGKIQIP